MADGDLLVAVLAAGAARRFGGGKLDKYCAGRRVGSWVIEACDRAGLPPGIIVTPPEVPRFAGVVRHWACVRNPEPERGLASSVAIAAHAAKEARAVALMLLLADMPLVEADFLAMLLASPTPAATRYPGDRAGVPVLLPARMFDEARELSGERGLAPLLAQCDDVALLDPPGRMLLDIDTPADLAEAESLLAARQPS